jgi:thiol-disulfide isomerase/thioredoxin
MKTLKTILLMFVILASFGAAVQAGVNKYYYVTPSEISQYITEKDGKRVVLIYASWCGYCRQAMPTMVEIAKQKKGKVIAISVDGNLESLLRYLDSMEAVPFPALVAKQEYEGELASELQSIGIKLSGGIPFMALLREDGSIEAQGNLRAEDVREYMLSD